MTDKWQAFFIFNQKGEVRRVHAPAAGRMALTTYRFLFPGCSVQTSSMPAVNLLLHSADLLDAQYPMCFVSRSSRIQTSGHQSSH